ncbi:MAG TPA: TIGR02186 family protein [Rhizomicrobium sp.]
MKRALLAFLLMCAPAQAEDLVSGLSQDQIQITSNYTGTDIVVFGAIENAGNTPGPQDVIVVVRGPDTTMVVRAKKHVAGIWVNANRVLLNGMPSYYFLASTRPIAAIAPTTTLQGYGLGLENLQPSSTNTKTPQIAEPYLQALIRHELITGLYDEDSDGVEFLSPSLFRARVPVPASVPRGEYNAQVFLLRGGTVVSAQSTPLFVDQTGLERRLYNLAHEQPLLYGLSAVAMAMVLGWLSSVIFRRST